MTQLSRIATLGAVLVTAGSGIATAADYVGRGGVIRDYGSIKDYRNVTPVPAPHPANEPQRDWYVRGDIGYGFYGDSRTSDHLFGGIGFGRYITPSLRSDITIDFKDSRSHDFTSTVNVYYDFDRHWAVKPYLGVGVGGAKFNTEGSNASKYGVALAAMAGFTIDIAPSIKLDTGYRFTWSDAGSSDGTDDHAIRTGIRIELYP